MKKEILVKLYPLVLAISIAGCKQAPPEKVEECLLPGETATKDGDSPRPCLLPTPNPEASLSVNPFLREFTPEQEEKMKKALERLKVVINSQEFKNAVLNHTYQNQVTFVDNNGMSNEEIYYTLLDGIEKLDPVLDNEVDLDITLYYSNNSTVGYTYPDTHRIWVNNKFFSGYSLSKVAANAVHEWTHKLGFGHDYSKTTRRNYSVPYGVGTIVKQLIEKM